VRKQKVKGGDTDPKMEVLVNALILSVILFLLFPAGTAGQGPGKAAVFPKPISSELPMYPEQAKSAHITGTVKLWFVVNESGGIAQAEVISGSTALRDGAVSVVKSWKFSVGSMQPKVRYETEFVYVLNVQSKSGEPKLTVSMVDWRRVEVASELYVEAIP
jgi:TonB family protein